MVKKLSVVIFLISCVAYAPMNEFIVEKKKPSKKVSCDDCCFQALQEGRVFARIIEDIGNIQGITLDLIDGVLEGNKQSLLKRATQDQLNEYMRRQEAFYQEQRRFQMQLQEHLKFLNDFEKTIVSKNKR